MRLFARAIGFGLLALAALAPVAGGLFLLLAEGPAGLAALGPTGWAGLAAGLALPSCLIVLAAGWLTQRAELAALRGALRRQAQVTDSAQLTLHALLAEQRDQSALLRDQERALQAGLALDRQQGADLRALIIETRLQRLVEEWRMTGRELAGQLAAMWRLVHGWRTRAGPEGEATIELPLPAPDELALAVLRLLPATAAEMALFEVDERLVRQAARYRATFAGFLDRAPETGPLNRALFRAMAYGRVDARLALLPRPNHGQTIAAGTLAAE